MRIAIDAIGINKYGGGRTATLHLLEELFAIDSENKYVVALSAYEPTLVSPFGNVKQWIIPIRNRFITRIYMQLVFPIKFWGFDLIHFTKNLNLLGIKPPQVVTMFDMTHVLHPELIPMVDHFYYKYVQRILLKPVKKIIAISHDAARGVEDYYKIPRNKIRVIHLAASKVFIPMDEDSVDKIRNKYNLPEEYFIHVGHLDRKKNLVTLVKAFYQVKQQTGFQGKLVLVGDQYPKGHDAELIPTINQLGLEKDIIFTGGVPDTDLPGLLSGAIAKVFPSIHEGFGLAPLEALACATPVIVSSAGAIGEVIGDAGIVLPNSNPESIAEAMITLLEVPGLREELSHKGYERSKEFSWEKTAQQTLEVYKQVVHV